jgi:hypothetical protein
MAKIFNFPLIEQQHEPHHYDELDNEIEIPEVNFDEMFAQPEDYVCRDKCYKCGHVFTDNDHAWSINQMGGYPSRFDGSQVDIEICDDCMCLILSNKITFDKDI